MKKNIFTFFLLVTFLNMHLLAQNNCSPCIGCDYPPRLPIPCPDCNNFGPVQVLNSVDPNEIIPPDGVGEEGWVRKDQLLNYMITFENDPDSATAAAQRVEIRLPLSPKLDLHSFQAGDFGFGDFYIAIPSGVSEYKDTVLSGSDLGVHVAFEAGIDVNNAEAYWIFTSLDTLTLEPTTDPFAGFLPVNDPEIHNGEGFVLFTVVADSSTVTFDEIDMKADIIFDLNAPLRTPMALNTIDADPPISQVDTVFFNYDSLLYQINLSGSDVGVGLADYTLYVSVDGGDFMPYFKDVDSSVIFTQIIPRHTYQFVSVARDSVGNVEPEDGNVEFEFYAYDPILEIPLEKGWNLAASYFYPIHPNILDLADPYFDTMLILKDYQGDISVPSLALNGIGEWDTNKGYQIKVTEDMKLKMAGAPLATEDNPLFMEEGWQIIPYLKQYPDSILFELALILSDVIIVKDNAGNVLFPEFEIDDIVVMEPFQAYWAKMADPSTLLYSDNYPGSPHPQIEKKKTDLKQFVLNDLNTGNNATLILPAEVLREAIELNDEIGVFTSDGLLCGAGVFEGRNLAIAIWGDDPQTNGVADGALAGEPFEIRIWSKHSDEVRTAALTLRTGEPVFFTNEIYILDQLELDVTSTKMAPSALHFKYYPNPTNGKIYFSFRLPQTTDVHLSVHSLDGKYARLLKNETFAKGLHEFSEDLSALPNALYVIRAVSGGASKAYKLILNAN